MFPRQEVQAPEQTLCPPTTLHLQENAKDFTGNGFTEMFLTGLKTAVPGSVSQGRGSSCPWSMAARGGRGGQGPRAGSIARRGAGPGKSGAAPRGGRSARLGSAGPQARKRLPTGIQEQQSGKEAPGPGRLQMGQEGITHIPPIRRCIPLEQSRFCLSAQPGLGTGSQLLWERRGSLSFPTVSTCLEVTSYDLRG